MAQHDYYIEYEKLIGELECFKEVFALIVQFLSTLNEENKATELLVKTTLGKSEYFNLSCLLNEKLKTLLVEHGQNLE
ncbi:hypothetical protein [Gemella cuniculi]|uniref:hypothetical protein n=1 Tax=Gemella cuniculi TaxID=150240 RepID=UPI0003FB987C|nr:hypothetical protein [Gemella cuniculi]